MSSNHPIVEPSPDMTEGAEPIVEGTVEGRRQRRLIALQAIAGLWSKRSDIPADGLEYQREMRAEWR